MARTTEVTVRTVVKDTTAQGGKENKFYRTWQFEVRAQDSHGALRHVRGLAQHGSARTGLSGGRVFSITRREALAKIQEKKAEGYGTPTSTGWNGHPDETVLQVNEDHLIGILQAYSDADLHKALLTYLQDTYVQVVFGANRAPKSESESKPEPVPVPPTVGVDRISKLNERALRALALAGERPAQAIAEYALLSGEVELLEVDVRKIRSYLSTLEALLVD